MADTHILVPMQVDALVMSQPAANATPFRRFTLDYTQLSQFGDPEPAAFQGGSDTPPNAGIYLYWTLPQALRHGTQTNGSTDFHLVPNRWLVTRVQQGQPAAQALTAWIVESDFYDPNDVTAGTSLYIQPQSQVQDSNNPYSNPTPTTIGRARPLTQVTSLDPQPAPFLQAVGPGNVLFSAFEPGAQNVLAFFDPVQDGNGNVIPSATFTYAVIGWYSDAPHDPLSGTTWEANPDTSLPGTYVNCTLPWYLYAASDALPTETLVHAMLSGVAWNSSADYTPPPSYPTKVPSTVQVALGSTAVDALAGLVSFNTGNQTEGLMLDAF
jgi:hypothetical protein